MVRAYLALLQFLCVLITQLHVATSQPELQKYYCYNSSRTANSTYQTNRNTLLSNLTSNKQIDYGFYNLSYGNYPNTVYAVGLCRGDVMPDFCRSCLKISSFLLPQLCPDQKQAFGMYCFKFPRKTCKELDSIVARFSWNGGKEGKKIHWKSWGSLTKSKSEGGMGFRDFEIMNDALPAKTA
ncbi:cysteine-rich repeat secretory protein 58-like [Neltuma alba]|uniref:cysteine-rich repeat secretory protein 58-like n=1 Tax=Neltuma alba TaxID=207710 RepID=UPI0010A3AE94|nr:cysteine-rich repeat secretory protein 58-like [Prosopis alba]